MKTIKVICVAAMLALASWTQGRGAVGPAPVPDNAPAMAPGGAGVPVRIEGELLVKFRGGSRGDAARRVQAEFGHKVLRDFEFIGWQHIKLPPGMSVDDALASYLKHSEVLAAEPNDIISLVDPLPAPMTTRVPNDPKYPQQWGLAKICASDAWDITTGSTNVVVAILDSGINYNHEDLVENMWRNSGEIPGNGIDDDGNGYVDDVFGADIVSNDGDPMDEGFGNGIYHGTGIAGIIGGKGNNGVGVTGINWDVRFMAFRNSDTSKHLTLAWMLAGQDYVLAMKERGVNVKAVNMSYGGTGTGNRALQDGAAALGQAGVVVVCAAGNSARNNDATPFYPASLDCPNIIAVAASTPSDELASFSNWGQVSVHLAAPGVDIVFGSGPGTTNYSSGDGTSYATPFVAGAVALLAAAWPEATVAQLKAAILDSVDVLPAFQAKVATGGRLNIGRAMQLAVNRHTNNLPPVLTFPPRNSTVFPGGSVRLSAGAIGGTPPISYQWFHDDARIAGATNMTLVLSNVLARQAGLWVQVSNEFGTAVSVPVEVTLVPVAAWGNNSDGQCDVPETLTNLVAVSGGRLHTVVLRNDGTVNAWGMNIYGACSVPIGLSNVTAISAGAFHNLALQSNGTVVAWGADTTSGTWPSQNFGQMIVPDGLRDVGAISAGQQFSLALRSNGTVVAWGLNNYGQASVPGDLVDVKAISAGYGHALALRSNGTVVAWGSYLGAEVVPAGLSNVVALAAGYQASLALKADGRVVAWGANDYGLLDVPAGLSNVVAIAGYWTFLATRNDGTVVTWGLADYGQLNVPTGLRNVKAVASNGSHSLALVPLPLAPVLAIQTQGANKALSWSESASGWQLLSATGLTPAANWEPWPGPLFTNQGSVFTPITPSNASHFFRLRSP